VTRRRKIILQVSISLVLLAASIGIVSRVPKISGSSWKEVTNNIDHIGIGTAVLILGLWIAGLAVYTIAMVASMPGLTHRRAMALNLAGSSAANLLPFGGVIGTGINLAMIRSWRLSARNFAGSAAVLNVANLVTKLSLPIIAGILVSHQAAASPWLGRSAYIASVLAAIVMFVMVVALVSRKWAVRSDRLINLIALKVRRRKEVPAEPARHVVLLQDQIREVFRRRWLGLAIGMIGYVLLQWALFALCMHTAGLRAPVSIIFAAFAVERALTLAVVTPAGTGIAEAAATGLLVALGYSPTASATGVLLYRLFVYLAEIPVGVVVLGAWASRRVARSVLANREDAAAAADTSSADMSSTDTSSADTEPSAEPRTDATRPPDSPPDEPDGSGRRVTAKPNSTTTRPPTPSKR
jgi:uncharacterized membrane protein YbhN (UPF0104 family)